MPGAFFDDNFDSYGTGANIVPTGFTVVGTGSSDITPNGAFGTNAWTLTNVLAHRGGFGLGDFFTACTFFHELNVKSLNLIQLGRLWNAESPYDYAHQAIVLFQYFMEADNTITFKAGGGTFLGNTGAPTTGAAPFALSSNCYAMLQINITFTAIPFGALHQVGVTIDVAINGVLLLSSVFGNSGAVVEALPGLPLAAANIVEYVGNGVVFDNMVLEDQVPINTYPHPQTRVARMSQMPCELAISVDDTLSRESQQVIELAIAAGRWTVGES